VHVTRIAVTLGEYKFASKKEAKGFFSVILNGCEIGEDLESENFDYVMALLLNHPRSTKKIGNGVKSIRVGRGYNSFNRCFHVVRNDESVEDFSVGKCIDGDHSPFHRFCVACRRSVEEDIRDYKVNYFRQNRDGAGKVKCQNSGQKISFEQAHVDHREPFTLAAIAHFFIQAKSLDLDSIEYQTEGKYGDEFADDSLSSEFRAWHKNNAKLRIVNGPSNLRKSYLGRVKSTKADGAIS